MRDVLCIPMHCECGERAVWMADLHWLAEERVHVHEHAPGLMESKTMNLPRGAVDVTGNFTVRCPRCLARQHVLSLIRSRLAAGAGLILKAPEAREAPRPEALPQPTQAPLGRGERLLGREGRRALRVAVEQALRVHATVTFALSVVDISVLGMLASHTHEIQPNAVYGLTLRLSPGRDPIRVDARAVWSVPHGYEESSADRRMIYRTGFEFVHLDGQAAAALDAYVSRCLSALSAPPKGFGVAA